MPQVVEAQVWPTGRFTSGHVELLVVPTVGDVAVWLLRTVWEQERVTIPPDMGCKVRDDEGHQVRWDRDNTDARSTLWLSHHVGAADANEAASNRQPLPVDVNVTTSELDEFPEAQTAPRSQ